MTNNPTGNKLKSFSFHLLALNDKAELWYCSVKSDNFSEMKFYFVNFLSKFKNYKYLSFHPLFPTEILVKVHGIFKKSNTASALIFLRHRKEYVIRYRLIKDSQKNIATLLKL
jgi:hypothetical protein